MRRLRTMLGRRGATPPVDGGPPAEAPVSRLTALLTERVADHFAGAVVTADRVLMADPAVSITCQVAEVYPGALASVALYFGVAGGPFGPDSQFASISGYGDTPELAVVEGACRWACMFRGGLASMRGRDLSRHRDADDDAAAFEAGLGGRRYRVHVADIDRFLATAGDPSHAGDDLLELRTAFGGEHGMTRRVLEAGVLPPLVSGNASLLSAFFSTAQASRIAEVKVRGGDWGPAGNALLALPVPEKPSTILLRELAILEPLDAPNLDRASIQRLLDVVGATRTAPHEAAGWRGWAAHGGRLGAPLAEPDLAAIERIAGRLPPDYRSFLLEVAGPGAGPGYGLLAPRFDPDGIPLALAGCGVAWTLRIDRDFVGEVWVDARACDGTWRRVAATFRDWYLDWLDSLVGSAAVWAAWDHRACACMKILATFIERAAPDAVERRQIDLSSITIRSGGAYVPEGELLDPSHPCVATMDAWGVPESVYVRPDQEAV